MQPCQVGHSRAAAERTCVNTKPAGTSLFASPEIQLVGLLAVALIFGGGGSKAAYFNLIVELAALTALALNGEAVGKFFLRGPWGLRILVGLSLLLPLAQLVPLPAVVWGALPGRDMVAQSFAVIGEPSRWYPVSLAPSRSILAFLAVIAALSVLVLGLRLDGRQMARVAVAVVALGLINLSMGVLQLTSANQLGNFYSGAQSGELYGAFSNHNSAGVFFVLTLIFVLSIPPIDGISAQARAILKPVCAALFCLAVILTRSRSSIALLGIVLLFYFPIALRMLRGKVGSGFVKWLLGGMLAIALLVGGAVYFGHNALYKAAARFEDLNDARTLIWQDGLESARRYMPVGAGMGAFDQVFQIDESLENVRKGRAGRAHNDYLEVSIEAGIPGVVLIAAWLAWLAMAMWSARTATDKVLRLGAGGVLVCVAIQSCIDYPLRNLALLMLCAFALAMLARRPAGAPKPVSRRGEGL